jgi:WD40 repeat protein
MSENGFAGRGPWAGTWRGQEDVLDTFERAWQDGPRPALAAYLPQGAGCALLLAELVHTDLEYRLKAGEPARVETYLEAYPELCERPGAVVELIAAEYELRRRREPASPAEAYLERFPDYHAALLLRLGDSRDEAPTDLRGNGSPTDGPLQTHAANGVPITPGYEIVRELGRGGMGVVYEARQLALNRLVALKTIRTADWGSAADARRFRQEAETVALLDHPHIVPVYEVGERGGQLYFSMKLIRDGSLAEHLGRFTANPRAAAQLVVTVARAVHHAHQRGILHRDIKPANILLDHDGQPHVADFGLARRVDADAGLTQSGALVGTPGYMAPEQAAGTKGLTTTATDVHGLGGLLYALLTGKPPFQGDSVLDTLARVRECEPEAPSGRNPRVGRDLEAVCLKSLEKEPQRRYGSAEALAEDLERWLAGQPVLARRVGGWGRFLRWCRRNPRVAGLGGTAAGLLVLLIASLAVSTAWIAGERTDALRQRDDAAQQRALAVEQAALVRSHLYAADLRLARQAWQDGDRRLFDALLSRQLPEPGSDDPRGFGWYYLRRLGQGERSIFRGPQEPIYHLAFSPDGKEMALAGREKAVTLLDAQSGQLLGTLTWHEGDVNWVGDLDWVAYSPDGKRMATASEDGTMRLWDRATRRVLRILAGHGEVVSAVYSPDGRTLASAGNDWRVRLWDLDTGQERAALQGHRDRIESLAFAPDGKTLASASKDGTARLWDVATHSQVQVLPHATGVCAVAFSPSGRALATGSVSDQRTQAASEVAVWDPGSGRKRGAFTGHAGAVQSVAFCDENTLASGSDDHTVRLWDVSRGEPLAVFPEHQGRVWCVAFSPDGRWLASTGNDRTVQVREWRRLLTHAFVEGRSGPVTALAYAPDARLLAAGGGDGCVRLWDPAARRLCGELPHPAPVVALAFAPDGNTLATAEGEGPVRLWDPATGGLRTELTGISGTPSRLAFAPDGQTLAIGDVDGAVSLWDLAAGRLRRRLSAVGQVNGLAFSPDGQTLAGGGGDGAVHLWDPATGTLRLTLAAGREAVTALAFTPDGVTLVAAARDGGLKSWDAAGRLRHELQGPGSAVLTLSLSPDGKTLATAGKGPEVRLWNVPTGQELFLVPYGFTDTIAAVAFSPDGNTLAAGGWQTTGRGELWLCPVVPLDVQKQDR